MEGDRTNLLHQWDFLLRSLAQNASYQALRCAANPRCGHFANDVLTKGG